MASARRKAIRRPAEAQNKVGKNADDPLMVGSVAKAFRVLSVFDQHHQSMGLSQIAGAAELDISATQRFAHTLWKLGYLRKDAVTKRFELTTKTLDVGYHFLRGNRLVDKAMPYLLHLSRETEETVNLTMLEGAEIVFVSRFLSRHMLNTDVIVGTRMPAYCTAPGIAMLSHLPEREASDVLDASDLKPHTPETTWRKPDLLRKLRQSAQQGYATAFEEYYRGDVSIAAAVLDARGRPEGAVNVAVSRSRYAPEEVVERMSSLVIATAQAISRS